MSRRGGTTNAIGRRCEVSDHDIARAHADEIIELDVEQSTKMLQQAQELYQQATLRLAASEALHQKTRRLVRWGFLLAVVVAAELVARWV